MLRLGLKVQGRPLLRLTTIGAKSGRRRHTVLGWFSADNGHAWMVVASNAGSVRHPGWAHNLANSPDMAWIDVGDGKQVAVAAKLLTGAERQTAWAQIIELAPGYGRYAQKTDREIPIFKLVPRG